MLDDTSLADADRWDDLIEQILAVPSPYRAAPGQPVSAIPVTAPSWPGRRTSSDRWPTW